MAQSANRIVAEPLTDPRTTSSSFSLQFSPPATAVPPPREKQRLREGVPASILYPPSGVDARALLMYVYMVSPAAGDAAVPIPSHPIPGREPHAPLLPLPRRRRSRPGTPRDPPATYRRARAPLGCWAASRCRPPRGSRLPAPAGTRSAPPTARGGRVHRVWLIVGGLVGLG